MCWVPPAGPSLLLLAGLPRAGGGAVVPQSSTPPRHPALSSPAVGHPCRSLAEIAILCRFRQTETVNALCFVVQFWPTTTPSFSKSSINACSNFASVNFTPYQLFSTAQLFHLLFQSLFSSLGHQYVFELQIHLYQVVQQVLFLKP